MSATPVLSLINKHGVILKHHPLPSSVRGKPWQINQNNGVSYQLKGLLQQIQPADHADLPEGSVQAVAVLAIPTLQPTPRPGDNLTMDDRHWRVKTVLPLVSNRRQRLVEAVVTSIGEGLIDYVFS